MSERKAPSQSKGKRINSGKIGSKPRPVKEKNSKCKEKCFKLFFMPWGKCCEEFLNGVSFVYVPENIRVHVFYSKSTPPNQLPKFANWLIGHESLTDSKDAVWIDLTAFVISMNARLARIKCRECVSKPDAKVNMAVVCEDDEKGHELAAILKANEIDMKVVDGRKNMLMDLFQHVCRCCKLIFKDSNQAEEHDKTQHNFLCHNTQCERSKRGNGFYTREELEIHLRAQKFCKFCPSDVFCTDTMISRHIKDNHSQCPCSCKDYYEREEDLFEQYYARYPLPCLEEPACEARFKDIDTQAFHHKTFHGAQYPYFCMACYKNEKLMCYRTGEELLDHVQDENHNNKDFQFAIIPRKIIQGSLK